MIRAIIILILFTSNVAIAALTASAAFEINAAGSSTGACIFDAGVAVPGTDRSQSTSAHKSNTDLASSNGTTNPCVVSSAGSPLTSDDEGNAIIVTAGSNWTVQRAIIVDVDGSGNATLDRACGSAASISGGTWKLGQACALGNSTSGISDDALFEMAVGGNKIHIKNGSYSPQTISLSATGSATAKIKVIGYNSTREDKPTIASGNQPVLTLGANTWGFGTHWEISDFTYTGTGATVVSMGGISRVSNVKGSNTSGTANRAALTLGNTTGVVLNSDLASTAGYALTFPNSNGVIIMGNRFHDSVSGARPSAAYSGLLTITDNIFSGLSTAAIDLNAGAFTGQAVIAKNTLYGAGTPAGSGLLFAASSGGISIISNIFKNWTTGCNGGGAITAFSAEKNAYHGNTTARTNCATGSDDISTDPEFANAGSGNFAPGINMKWRGWPASFPAGTSTSYNYIGAVQPREGLPRGRK